MAWLAVCFEKKALKYSGLKNNNIMLAYYFALPDSVRSVFGLFIFFCSFWYSFEQKAKKPRKKPFYNSTRASPSDWNWRKNEKKANMREENKTYSRRKSHTNAYDEQRVNDERPKWLFWYWHSHRLSKTHFLSIVPNDWESAVIFFCYLNTEQQKKIVSMHAYE